MAGSPFTKLRESVILTARATAMVCWLFVGSTIFSSVFGLLGGQDVIKDFMLWLDLGPLGFMLLVQVIIFLLGWPLEWTEIIVIFVPIFLPLLQHFGIDPLFFGLMVALNIQTSFLSPPVAMAAFYLKGVVAAARHHQSDFRRDDAIHVHRHHRDGAALHLSGDRALAASGALRQGRGWCSPSRRGIRRPDAAARSCRRRSSPRPGAARPAAGRRCPTSSPR